MQVPPGTEASQPAPPVSNGTAVNKVTAAPPADRGGNSPVAAHTSAAHQAAAQPAGSVPADIPTRSGDATTPMHAAANGTAAAPGSSVSNGGVGAPSAAPAAAGSGPVAPDPVCPLCLGILQSLDAHVSLPTSSRAIALPETDAGGGTWQLSASPAAAQLAEVIRCTSVGRVHFRQDCLAATRV